VVDETGQDAIEVEAAADVARHAAQRLGPVELARDVVRPLRAADDGADRLGRDPRDLDVVLAERIGRLAGDEQDAPRRCGAGIATASSGRPSGSTPVERVRARREEDRREGQPPGPAPAGLVERPAEEPDGPGRSTRRTIAASAADWARGQPIAAQLPDRDEVVAVGVADRLRRGCRTSSCRRSR
jgi:hypothetical protein